LNPTVSVIVRNGTAVAAVTAEHLATEEIALAGDPFVSPRVLGASFVMNGGPIC
jgi:hypothetical protein